MYLSKTFISQGTNDAERVQGHAFMLWSVGYHFLPPITYPCHTSGNKRLQQILPQVMPLISTALSKHTLECPKSWLHLFLLFNYLCVDRAGEPTTSYLSKRHQGMPLHCVLVSQSSRCSHLMARLKNLSLSLLYNLPPPLPEFQELGCAFRRHLIRRWHKC